MRTLEELFEMTEVFFSNAVLSTNDYIDYLYKQINLNRGFPFLLGFSSTQKSERADEIREKKRRAEFFFHSILRAQREFFLDDAKRNELVQLWMNIAGGDYVNNLIETAYDEDDVNSLAPKFRSLDIILQIHIQIELRIIVENILALIADVLSSNDTQIDLSDEVREETAELAEWVAQYSTTRANNYTLLLQTLRSALNIEKIYTRVSVDADKAVADLQRQINRIIKQFAFPLKGERALKTPLAFSRIPSIRTSVVTSPAPEPFSAIPVQRKNSNVSVEYENVPSSRFSSPASERRPRVDSESQAPIINTDPVHTQLVLGEDQEEKVIDIKSMLKKPYTLSTKLRAKINAEHAKIKDKYENSIKDPKDYSVLALIQQNYALKMITEALVISDRLLEPPIESEPSGNGEVRTYSYEELRKSVKREQAKHALRTEGDYLSPRIVEHAFFPPQEAIIFAGKVIQREENKIFEPARGFVFDSDPEVKSIYSLIKKELLIQMWDRVKVLPLYRDLLLSEIQVGSMFDLKDLVNELREKTKYLVIYQLELTYNKIPLDEKIKPGIIYLYVTDNKIKFKALNGFCKIETYEISDDQLSNNFQAIKSTLQSGMHMQLYPDQEREIFKITSKIGFPPQFDETIKLSSSQVKECKQRLAVEVLLYCVDGDSPQLSATVLELLKHNYPLEMSKVVELVDRIENELKAVLWDLGKEDFKDVIGLTCTQAANKRHGPTHPGAKAKIVLTLPL